MIITSCKPAPIIMTGHNYGGNRGVCHRPLLLFVVLQLFSSCPYLSSSSFPALFTPILPPLPQNSPLPPSLNTLPPPSKLSLSPSLKTLPSLPPSKLSPLSLPQNSPLSPSLKTLPSLPPSLKTLPSLPPSKLSPPSLPQNSPLSPSLKTLPTLPPSKPSPLSLPQNSPLPPSLKTLPPFPPSKLSPLSLPQNSPLPPSLKTLPSLPPSKLSPLSLPQNPPPSTPPTHLLLQNCLNGVVRQALVVDEFENHLWTERVSNDMFWIPKHSNGQLQRAKVSCMLIIPFLYLAHGPVQNSITLERWSVCMRQLYTSQCRSSL